MKKGMRILRNLAIMAVFMAAAVVAMPKSVRADNSTTIDSTKTVYKGATGQTVTAEYTIDTGYKFAWGYDDSSGILRNEDGSVDESNKKLTFTFDANATGTATVSVWIYETAHPDTKLYEKTCTITVNEKKLSLDATDIELYKGDTDNLMASAQPAGAFTPDVEWSTSDSNIATVSGGKVTAVGVGTCTITAHQKDSSDIADATCKVTVNAVTTTLKIDKTSVVLYVGATANLVAEGTPHAKVDDITFEKTDSEGVIDVDNSAAVSSGTKTGVIKAKKTGTATVKATATIAGDSKESESCTITVQSRVTAITASIPEVSAGYKTASVTPAITQESGGGSDTYSITDIAWTDLTPDIATLTKNSDGTIVVNGKSKGTAQFKAALGSYSVPLDVTVKQPATGFTSSVTDTSVNTATTLSGTVAPANSDATTVKYECTSKPSGATATLSGTTFTGDTAGSYTIKATVDNSSMPKDGGTIAIADVTKTFTIKVSPVVQEISWTEPVYITVGSSFKRDIKGVITITPSNATYKSIEVTSSDSKLQISGTNVTGKSTGDAKVAVTITNYDGTTVSVTDMKITVLDKPKLSYSDNKLSLTQPTAIYTGSSNDIDSVTKGVIEVYYDGSCLWTSDRTSDYKDGKTISADSIQTIIKKSDIYDKIKSVDKDEMSLEFRLYGASDSKTNDDAYGSADVSVYRVTVSGTGITTTKDYAVKGVSLKLTATPLSGYSFSSWSDGTTTNPRSVTVSGAASYTATGVLGVKATTTPSSSAAASSKYDKVPKTGESAALWAMWAVFIVLILGAGAMFLLHFKPEILGNGNNPKDNISKK